MHDAVGAHFHLAIFGIGNEGDLGRRNDLVAPLKFFGDKSSMFIDTNDGYRFVDGVEHGFIVKQIKPESNYVITTSYLLPH